MIWCIATNSRWKTTKRRHNVSKEEGNEGFRKSVTRALSPVLRDTASDLKNSTSVLRGRARRTLHFLPCCLAPLVPQSQIEDQLRGIRRVCLQSGTATLTVATGLSKKGWTTAPVRVHRVVFFRGSSSGTRVCLVVSSYFQIVWGEWVGTSFVVGATTPSLTCMVHFFTRLTRDTCPSLHIRTRASIPSPISSSASDRL